MSFTEENMGQAFKEALDGLEIKPSESVWDSVNKANLKSGVTKPLAQFSNLIYGIVAAVILVSSIYVIYSFNNKSKDVNKVSNKIDNVVTSNIQNDITVAEPIVTKEIVVQENIESENKQESTDNKKENSSAFNKKIIIASCGDKPAINEKEAFASVDSMENNIALEEDTIEGDTIAYKEEDYSEHKISKEQGGSNIYNEVNSKVNESKEIIIDANADTFNVKYSEDPIICFGEDAILRAEEGYTYQWNTGSRDDKISVSPVEKSYYKVTVTNKLGQTNIHKFTVTIDKECSALLLPSAFTPNGDGKNDVFKAEGIGITKLLLTVYSSIGQMVFETRNVDQAWDGRYKGELMPAATYFYQVSYTDAKGENHIKRGQIILIR